ncbi:MAG: hypothetical protein ACJ8DC_01865 [Gemmatimonadales bacterium]
MGIHSRSTPLMALVGILLLGAAPGLRAQQTTNAPKDTSAMAQPDTGAYQGYQRNDSSQRNDSTQSKYNGPPTDTTLKAKPGVQTGPTSGKPNPSAAAGAATSADTVVCKDGSNASKAAKGCTKHGGIDWAATRSALKARGQMQGGDTSAAAPSDTSKKSADTSSSYQKP